MDSKLKYIKNKHMIMAWLRYNWRLLVIVLVAFIFGTYIRGLFDTGKSRLAEKTEEVVDEYEKEEEIVRRIDLERQKEIEWLKKERAALEQKIEKIKKQENEKLPKENSKSSLTPSQRERIIQSILRDSRDSI